MRRSIRAGPGSSVFSKQGMPLFVTYLIWGTGSGAQTLGRPLFAFELTDSIFLVTLLIAALGASRIISAPLTGFLSDRIGRKPLAVIGAGLRGGASFAVLYVDNYAAFFVLELIGNTGVSMWQTTSQVVIADMSTPENRGRAVAMRNSSMRLGQIIGPVLGGVIAATWGLQEVFVVNGVSKFLVMFITLYLIGETRPERAPRKAEDQTSLRADLLPIILSRAFVALALTTLAAALIGQGIVQVMFPHLGTGGCGADERPDSGCSSASQAPSHCCSPSPTACWWTASEGRYRWCPGYWSQPGHQCSSHSQATSPGPSWRWPLSA